MPIEVQQYIPGKGWRNEWVYDEGDGVLKPETFNSATEAFAALDELFEDIAVDIAAGHCPPCRREEFRVQYVLSAETEATVNAKGE